MADLITAEMGSPKSFSRLGQGAGALAQMHLNLATAKEFPGSSVGRDCSAMFRCGVPRSASSVRSCRGTCRSC